MILRRDLCAGIWVLWAKKDGEPGKAVFVEGRAEDSWLNEF